MGIGPFSILLLKMTKTSVVVHMLCAFGTYPIDKTEKIGDSEKSHLGPLHEDLVEPQLAKWSFRQSCGRN